MRATAEELAAGIQFVIDGRGEVTSVVLSPQTWRQLIGQLEDSEDRELLAKLMPKLAQGPVSALPWNEVEDEWA